MKANYTRDQVTVKALITALNKINMLLYSESFNKQQRACVSFTKLIDKYACEYNDKYINKRKKRIDLNVRVASLEEINDWLCDENANFRKYEPFTFDKSKLRSLELENADLRAEVTQLTAKLKSLEPKGVKK